ncbi:MAG: response regulator [Rhodobacteraceae bacterium]|nr:response regulator [Paracoccaceae bacterium]
MKRIEADFSTFRFLVADDSNHVRRIVCNMLKRCNAAEILQASNGSEALQQLTKSPFEIDCIFSDWNMEPVDGLALLAAVRSGNVTNVRKETRIIMLTGHSESDVVHTAIALDASGFLVKPVAMEKLVKTVETVMAREVELKAAKDYLDQPMVRLPDTLRLNRRSIPKWAATPQGSNESRALSEALELMRSEASALASHAASDPNLRTARVRRTLSEIEEGAVLAEDIFDGDGLVLIASGTKLSSDLIRGIKDVAGPRQADVQFFIARTDQEAGAT